jgi:elongation factor Ts
MISASLVKELREKTGAGMLDCKKALESTEGSLEAAIDWLREKGISKAAKKADRIAAEGLSSILIDGNNAVILEVNSETDFVAKNAEFVEMVETIAKLLLREKPTTVEEALTLNTENGSSVEELIMSKTATIGEKISFRRFTLLTKNDDQSFGNYIHMGGKIAVLTLITNSNSQLAKDVAMHSAAMRPLYITRSEVSQEEIEHEKLILKEQAINEGKPEEIALKMVEGRIQKFYKEVCLEEQPFVKNPDVDVKTHTANNGASVIKMVRYEVGEGIEKKEENFADEVMNQIKHI